MKKFLPKIIYDKLVGRPGFKKILNNAGWLTFDRIFNLLIALLVGVWVARYLGPEQYGLLSYAGAFVALFAPIATLGLGNIVIREVVNNPNKKDELLGTAFFMMLVASILTFILSLLFIFLARPDNALVLVLVSLIAASTIFRSFDIIDPWFQSQVKSKFTVIAKNTAFLITSIIKVILILINAPLITFAGVLLVDAIIGAIAMIIVYKVDNQSITAWKFRFNLAKSLLRDSWPLILSGIAVMVYMRIDQIMLGQLLGDSSVGIYSVAVKLCEILYFLPGIVLASLFPAILRSKKISKQLYMFRLQKLYDFMLWVSIAIATVMAIFSYQIVYFLYGVDYLSASPVLSIYIWSTTFVFLGTASQYYLLGENLTKLSFYMAVIGAVLNICLNLILIPVYGISGAALTTVMSYFVASVLANLFFKKTRVLFFMFLKSMNLYRIVKEIVK